MGALGAGRVGGEIGTIASKANNHFQKVVSGYETSYSLLTATTSVSYTSLNPTYNSRTTPEQVCTMSD